MWGAWREAFDEAVAAYRAAAARRKSLGPGIAVQGPVPAVPPSPAPPPVRSAAAELGEAAAALTEGWAGAEWAALAAVPLVTDRATGRSPRDLPLRIGAVRAAADVSAPFLVNLLGAGHLTIDAPVRDPRVAALFQGVVLRALAASGAGDVRVVLHDPAGLGTVLGPFRQLVDAGVVLDGGADRERLLACLDAADAQVQAARRSGAHRPRLLLALTALPPGVGADVEARLAALAHAGPAAGISLVLAQWPPVRGAGQPPPPQLESATALRARGGFWSPDLPDVGAALDLPVELDPAPPAALVAAACRALAARVAERSRVTFAELLVDPPWACNSADGLATPVGRAPDTDELRVLRFDDATPHWLVAGRSGSGKTVFLLDVLAGLAVRYPPTELELYLLDFKEGVSFAEFTPSPRDPSWLPHAVAVGVESDREYGLAVLQALRDEMARRAAVFRQLGVSSLAALRTAEPTAVAPRILAVIDEYQILFAGNDDVARRAAALLEDIARKGRSFGVHLVLSSQTAAGIEALQTKTEAIFGQFPLRVALAGGGTLLDPLSTDADALPVGTAVVNTAGGAPGAGTLLRLPLADPTALTALRHDLWQRRAPAAAPPSVFAGFAEQHVDDDPTFALLRPDPPRPVLLVGRAVGVGSPTVAVDVDAVPGSHLAVVGPSGVGGDVLHAALCGLGRQYLPGAARFVVAPLVAAGRAAAQDAVERLEASGHDVAVVPLDRLAGLLAELAASAGPTAATSPDRPTYLALFGAEAAGPVLSVVSTETFRPGSDDLRAVVQNGPARGVHVLGWWRSLSRLAADLGPSAREDVASLLALDVPETDLQTFLGRYDLRHTPRPNRGLLLDRHRDAVHLVVPFVRSRSVTLPNAATVPTGATS